MNLNNKPQKMAVANWKQNGDLEQLYHFMDTLSGLLTAKLADNTSDVLDSSESINDDVESHRFSLRHQAVICPACPYLMLLGSQLSGLPLELGAQDISADTAGARTGDVSGAMLADLGARYVLVGHSERRLYHHENEPLFVQKIQQAWHAGLIPIYCVGETQEERAQGQTEIVLRSQIEGVFKSFATNDTAASQKIIIAYEPRWAIGTGLVPSYDEIAQVCQKVKEFAAHAFCAERGQSLKVLYGGSVNAENSAEILALDVVDGVLIGGASLDAQSFFSIIS